MSRCFRSGRRFSIISALIILPFSFTANSVSLSTITDRSIQGAEPRLSGDLEAEIAAQAFNRFGFTYNGTSYTDQNIKDLPKIAPLTMTPSLLKSQLKSTFENTLSVRDATDANGDGNFTLSAINGEGDTAVSILPEQLSIKIRDSNNVDVAGLAATKDKTFCDLATSTTYPGPYKIEISHNLRLTTEYGDPRKKDYIAIDGVSNQPTKQYPFFLESSICYGRPGSMTYASGGHAGPAEQWNTEKGFIFQSDSNYAANFPTMGANSLYFDLYIVGEDEELTWDPVKVNEVTATASMITNKSVRITLTGPAPTIAQQNASNPSPVEAFTSPTEIVLQGKDSTSATKLTYGFKLTKWFIDSPRRFEPTYYINWCRGAGNDGANYELGSITDVTNAKGAVDGISFNGTSSGNYYQRTIGGGLLAEWGRLPDYGFANHTHSYLSNTGYGYRAFIYPKNGNGVIASDRSPPNGSDGTLCVSK